MKLNKTIVIMLTLLVIPVFLSGCELLESLGYSDGVLEPTAIYAVEVVEENLHDCDTTNQYCDTSRILGPPDETSPWSGHFVSLGGAGGSLTARMAEPFTNGPGPDLYIYEVGVLQGGGDEPFTVYISVDMTSWIEVATEVQNDENSVYASIEFGDRVASGSYRYVRIEDRANASGGASSGSDIDAMEARWSANY